MSKSFRYDPEDDLEIDNKYDKVMQKHLRQLDKIKSKQVEEFENESLSYNPQRGLPKNR